MEMGLLRHSTTMVGKGEAGGRKGEELGVCGRKGGENGGGCDLNSNS
jgi:hypothetical protein